ncbi:YebC/PmpR family DNA-binding transcriptional regulator [Thermostilla marina]
MAGHSHWAGIKHKKAANDAKRGKIWSKISKAIIVAARMGGGDPKMNPRLRVAIEDAKAAHMPKDNIERAIKRGTGELEGQQVEEVVYEGYGPGGVAILCEALTDNRNRTTAELRKIFEVGGGKMGAAGSVAWMFKKKGIFVVSADKVDEEKLMEVVLEAGGEDIQPDDGRFEVTCDPGQFSDVSEALENAGIECESKSVSLIPNDYVDLDTDTARKVLKLLERLDDHDDVQNVSSNFNIPDELMAELGSDG